MIAATSLLVVVLIGIIAGRIGALALTSTGLPSEVSRFQARSALTGVGFTTSESEAVMSHPVRRRIMFALMLVGNAGFVTLAGSMMLSFTTAGGTSDVLRRLGVILGGTTVLMWLLSRRRIESAVTAVLTKLLNRFSDLELRDYHHLMRLSADYSVTELAVRSEDWLADQSLADLDLPDEGVLVLAVQRADGKFIGAPPIECVVYPNDTLYLYGRAAVLDDLDHRERNADGERAHHQAVAEHRAIERENRSRMRLPTRLRRYRR